MARRWFSRTGLTLESEQISVIGRDSTKFTFNGNRVLTNQDVTTPTITTNTATLDVGNITTMSVRGTSTSSVPITLCKSGKVVTMEIPNVVLSAQTGAATQIHLAGAGIPAAFRPQYQVAFSIVGVNNGANVDLWLVVLTTGDVWVQLYSSAALTLPAGTKETTCSWITA